MRLGRSIESKRGVNEPGYEPPLPAPELEAVEEPKERYTVNPVGIGLAVLGGVLLAISTFLPLDEPESALARIQDNTLIQHEGWTLIVLGAVIVLAAASPDHKSISVCILSLIAGGVIAYFATNKSLRTLYPVGKGGEGEATGNGTVVPLGLAIYVAGAGALLSFAGGWTMFSSRKAVDPDEETQRCPECAETILAAAHVCKHCGARLTTSYPPPPA